MSRVQEFESERQKQIPSFLRTNTSDFLQFLCVVLFFSFFLFSAYDISQENDENIEIKIPSIQDEASYIWRTINDIEFLESHGYRIHLPKDPLVDSLILKSKNKTFGNDDFPTIYNLLESKIYDKNDYQKSYDKVIAQKELLMQLLNEIKDSKDSYDWNFQTFNPYVVSLTLYGTGGSYDPETGSITLFTTRNGKFMNYSNPANTIIHEMVHIGMEKSLVQKYKLPHSSKERLVDLFVFTMFKDRLPEYRIQNMGDKSLDDTIQNKKDLYKLSQILSQFSKK